MPTALIAGLGFMGGSLAGALTAAGWQVVLHHRRASVADAAAERGWGVACHDLSTAPSWDVAVAAVPVGAIADTVRTLAATGTGVITDLGSTKTGICHDLLDLAETGRFVGAHPLCGSHLQGLDHANPGLYRSAPAVVTPLAGTPDAAVEVVSGLWKAAGCRVRLMTPEAHDAALAESSHVPHVLASLCASQLAPSHVDLAATGFRDTSRVAAGAPELWRDILLGNREPVLAGLVQCQQLLEDLRQAMLASDGDAVAAWLAAGAERRAAFDALGACPPPDTA